MVILLPLLVCIIGLLMYALSANPKLVEIGRIMFFAGLLATLLGAGPVVSTLRVSSAGHSAPLAQG
jgi:Na+/phosphate symporter